MREVETLWREDVERDLEKFRLKKANEGRTGPSFSAFRRRFAVHYWEGVRMGIPYDDELLASCLYEVRGWVNTCSGEETK